MKKTLRLLLLSDINFNEPKIFTKTLWIAPFLFGLVSLWLGADINWDLLNYHLYNPFSLFNKKLHIDFAPAGMQTYFNPTIDIPYYWMVHHLPAPLVGFIMGTFHGINFVLLALIARQVVPLPAQHEYKLPLMLALFGCLTANFLTQLGNTMGDATTAVFILSAVCIVVTRMPLLAQQNKRAIFWILLAGFCAGCAAGLKLTNLVYATALCISILLLPLRWFLRIQWSFLFGVGVLLGLASTGGHWFLHLWNEFHNPLFPQFGHYFPNPLIASDGVVDIAWRPKTLVECFIWPYIITFYPLRVGELKQIQVMWAVVYSLLLIWPLVYFFARKKITKPPVLPWPALFLLAFVIIGFLIWMKIFSIQRYLVAIELCTPLIVYLVLSRLLGVERAHKFAVGALVAMSVLVVVISRQSWGHAPWAQDMFSIEQPAIADPNTASVLTIGGAYPHGWITTLFPASVAFIQVDGENPFHTANYITRMHEITQSRRGEIFIMFKREEESSRSKRVKKFNAAAEKLGLLKTETGCRAMRWLLFKTNASVQVKYTKINGGGYSCEGMLLGAPEADVSGVNQEYIDKVVERAKASGYAVRPETCTTFNAYIGEKAFPMYWCKVEDLVTAQ